MAYLVEFKTARFDPSKEPPNPINPIAGQSALVWLREKVLPTATEPDHEDWGWYIEVEYKGARYLVGSICFEKNDGAVGLERDWMFQIHRNRSFVDKALGRNKMQVNDPLVARVVGALRADSSFTGIEEKADA
jgi:hypothetical protein